MGRRFRRGGSKSSKKSSDNRDGETTTFWSTHRHRDALIQYLKDYRDGAEALYHGKQLVDDDAEVCIINGIVLPALTNEVLEQPFLELPKLSSKQRKMVHECCLEVNLFHASIGTSRHSRRIAVSLYADGFETFVLENQDSEDHRAAQERPRIYKYSPWYCRNHSLDNARLNLTEKIARQTIAALVSEPEKCLRESLDVIQVDPRKPEDLSQHHLPLATSGHTLQEDDTIFVVDSAEKMMDCIFRIEQSQPTEIGFDLECYNPSKYAQICCLLQITCNTLNTDFIIDTLAPGVWENVSGLAPLFANPTIVKVGHAIGSLDVTSLHRDFGIFCINTFDTYEAAKALNLPGKGLGDVCRFYGMRQANYYKSLKDKYQACDWRTRPLTPAMIEYARLDVHYLLALRRIMMRDLVLTDLPRSNDTDELVETLVDSLNNAEKEEAHDLDSDEETPRKKNRSFLALFRGKSSAKTVKPKHVTISTITTDDSTSHNMHPQNSDTCAVTHPIDDEAPFNGASLDGEPVAFNRDTGELFFFTPEKSALPIESASALDEQFWTPENDLRKFHRSFVIDSSSLRKSNRLMETITKSQQACQSFFTLGKEPHAKNTLFVSLLQRAAKNQVNWTNENTKLYAQLARWRHEVADRLHCLPGFVASLEFLTGVAWKLPTTVDALALISSDLPEALADDKSLCHEILALVRECCPEAPDHTIYYYCSSNRGKSRRTTLMRQAAWTIALGAGIGCILLYTKAHRKLLR